MTPRLLISLALTALVAPWASATTTQTTEPVGFMRYAVETGLQTIGFPLVEGAVVSGAVVSVNTGSLQVNQGSAASALSSALDEDRAYYLEFTAGPDGDDTFVGDRIELAVDATMAAANPADTVRLQLDSAHSTLHTLPDDLAGYRFVIRPHVTLASAFGTGATSSLQGGTNTRNGDQVHVLRDGAYQTFLFQADVATGGSRWVKFPEGTPADRELIAPGTGMFLRHVGTGTVTIRHLGSVRTNAFVQPLAAGYSLVSEPFPVSVTLVARGMTEVNGFVPGTNLNDADSLLFWTGSDYETLYYSANVGAPATWLSSNVTAASVDQGSSDMFSPFGAVLIQKHVADPAYVVPCPL